MKRAERHRILLFVAVATLIVLQSAAAGQVRWLADEAPFIVSREARDCLAQLTTEHSVEAVTVNSIIDDATVRYTELLQSYSERIDHLDGFLAERVCAIWPEWRHALIDLGDRGTEQIEAALSNDSAEAWRFRNRCYSYSQVIRLIHRDGLLSRSATIPDLLEVLAQAKVDISPASELHEVLIAEVEVLAELADRYWRDGPQLFQIAADETASERQRHMAVERIKAIIDNLRESTYRAAGAIAVSLEGDARARFENILSCRWYPEFCGQTPVDVAVQLLRKSDSIRKETQSAIEVHYRRYLADHIALRVEFVEHQQYWDSPEASAQRDEEFKRLWDKGKDPYDAWRKHPGLPSLRRLFTLQAETVRALRALFTEDKFSHLPGGVQLALTWPEEGLPAELR